VQQQKKEIRHAMQHSTQIKAPN